MINYKKYPPVTAFTTTAKGYPREIITQVMIRPPSYLGLEAPEEMTRAIWDTGATGSVISKELASIMNLIPSGKCKVSGVHDIAVVNTYELDIHILRDVIIRDVTVSEGQLSSDPRIGFLIGMDIINLGDFAYSTKPDGHMFSFRIPGIPEPIDFKADIDEYITKQRHKQLTKKAVKKMKRK